MTAIHTQHRIGAAIALVTLAFLLSVPLWGSAYLQRSIVEFLYFLALAQIWNFMAGYAGMFSIGQQAWVGVGAYALIVLAQDLGLNPFWAVPVTGVIAALMALPTSWLLFRLKGAYFAVASWVIAETIRLAVNADVNWLGGGRGRSLTTMGQFDRGFREDMTYLLVVGITIVAFGAMVWLLRSRVGLGLMAMRDNAAGAGGVGVAVNRTRRIVYLAASGLAGIVGALIFMSALNVRPDAAFSINWVAYPIFIVIIGGIGTIEGPIIGAIVFYIMREYLDAYEAWSLLAFGLIAIAMMLFAPKGIWGMIQSRWDIELFPIRRRLPAQLSTKTTQET